jgi:transposase InsO family protein
VSDEELLAKVRADLASSPFTGEGHRKVWARLRVSGVRVRRERVLRVMRENRLLSPHRVRVGAARLHEGRITTDRPDDVWGTDGARVETAQEGMCWLFIAIDHCQYVADDFSNQVRAWGKGASYAFVSEPQTNGVAERFIRTLKGQAIHGRAFRTVEEVRTAVRAFVETCNTH